MAKPKVAVWVGTRKGTYALASDEHRRKWSVRGPYHAGNDVFHVVADPREPRDVLRAREFRLVRPAGLPVEGRRRPVDRGRPADDGPREGPGPRRDGGREARPDRQSLAPHPGPGERAGFALPRGRPRDAVPLGRPGGELDRGGRAEPAPDPPAVEPRRGRDVPPLDRPRPDAAETDVRRHLRRGRLPVRRLRRALDAEERRRRGQLPAREEPRGRPVRPQDRPRPGRPDHRLPAGPRRDPRQPRLRRHVEAGREGPRPRLRVRGHGREGPPGRGVLRPARAVSRLGVGGQLQVLRWSERTRKFTPTVRGSRSPATSGPTGTRWTPTGSTRPGIYLGTTTGQLFVSPDGAKNWTEVPYRFPAIHSVTVSPAPSGG